MSLPVSLRIFRRANHRAAAPPALRHGAKKISRRDCVIQPTATRLRLLFGRPDGSRFTPYIGQQEEHHRPRTFQGGFRNRCERRSRRGNEAECDWWQNPPRHLRPLLLESALLAPL